MAGLLDIFFPPSCVACGRVLAAEAFFCAACDETVEHLTPDRCGVCAEPGVYAADQCPRCTARPPPFFRAFAPFAHEGAIARAIHQFKYEDHPELARPLAELSARESPSFLSAAPGIVAAVPLHRGRLRQRRYDQAELLAGELARLTGRTRVQALTRDRATQRQVGLSETDRDANVDGAFACTAPVEGAEILLVDDVLTTGATARAAATALRRAGAREVWVFTVARAFSS